MPGFIDAVRKYSEDEGAARSHGAFVYKSLKVVCKHFDIVPPGRDWDSRLGFSWFHEQYPDFPVRLEASKYKISLEDLFLRPSRMEVWQELRVQVEEHDSDIHAFGVIVPSKKGLYVLHDWRHGPFVSGYTRVEHKIDDDHTFVFESVKAFCESVQCGGWSK